MQNLQIVKRLFRLFLCLIWGFALALIPRSVFPSVGFAEWEIYTPEGNLISHIDGWKEEFGTCLRTGDPELQSRLSQVEQVFVARLERWQYNQGYVIGQDREGYFIFNESNRDVRHFQNETDFLTAREQMNLEPSQSWLTEQEGWEEAWFPYFVWQPCQELLNGRTHNGENLTSMGYSTASCTEKLSPERLAQYRDRTWGRQCKIWMANPLSLDSEQMWIQEFCSSILNESSL